MFPLLNVELKVSKQPSVASVTKLKWTVTYLTVVLGTVDLNDPH